MQFLAWMPPGMAQYIFTVFLKPKFLRNLAQRVVRCFIPKRMRVRGVELALNQTDAVMSGALALGCYEGYTLDLFESLLKPGMQVLDIGANIGLYTAIAAKAVGPEGNVLAIEPSPENSTYLHQTISINGFTNVQTVQKAIGASRGKVTLFLNPDNKGDHRIYQSPSPRFGVPVDLTPLDDLLDELKISRVDIIKMDVQGAEALVFQGMSRCMARNPHLKIIMEFWPWGLEQSGCDAMTLLGDLRSKDFEIQEIDDNHRTLVFVLDDHQIASRKLERQYSNLFLHRRAA